MDAGDDEDMKSSNKSLNNFESKSTGLASHFHVGNSDDTQDIAEISGLRHGQDDLYYELDNSNDRYYRYCKILMYLTVPPTTDYL